MANKILAVKVLSALGVCAFSEVVPSSQFSLQ